MPRRLIQRDNLLMEMMFLATLFWGIAGFVVWRDVRANRESTDKNRAAIEQERAAIERVEKKIDFLTNRVP